MIFGEKLKALRAERNMTQKELAKALGVSLRTVSNYETGGLRPRYASVYDDLARIFEVPKNYLLTDEDAFVLEARSRHGNKGAREAQELVEGVVGLFAGGRLDEADKQAVFETIQEAYFRAKLENKKYTPKAYRKDDEV
ncbi:Predicted transcriptional regulator [Aedoeadaptatus ivorii]|uniref:Predicted transcriptional regulator n=1 Tax=Aedoeadaptatus ivorii TaxID=54006 RepID=A0A3S4YW78_9FIRM|nr:helix-turn-helix transcriptional regulator [Peptoniphilus ivorii]MDQ0508269.1 transcriptional regulator with XRE-family HTH domain [Peptoniphilus ivorii]VEJ36243.1 Predicted transcriptional regulator [Peptoniphilus ivorii]